MEVFNKKRLEEKIQNAGGVSHLPFRIYADNSMNSIQICFYEPSILNDDEEVLKNIVKNNDYKVIGSFTVQKGNPNALEIITLDNIHDDKKYVSKNQANKARANKKLRIHYAMQRELSEILEGTTARATTLHIIDDNDKKTNWAYVYEDKTLDVNAFLNKVLHFMNKNCYDVQITPEEYRAKIINYFYDSNISFINNWLYGTTKTTEDDKIIKELMEEEKFEKFSFYTRRKTS